MKRIFSIILLAIMIATGASAQSAEYKNKAAELMKSGYGEVITSQMGYVLKQAFQASVQGEDESSEAREALAALEPMLLTITACEDFQNVLTQCMAIVCEKKMTLKEMDQVIKVYSNPEAKTVMTKGIKLATEILPELFEKISSYDENNKPAIPQAQCSKEYRKEFLKCSLFSSSVTTTTTTTTTTEEDGKETTTSEEVTEESKGTDFIKNYMTEYMLDKASKTFTLKELKLLSKISEDPAVKKINDAMETMNDDPQCQAVAIPVLGKLLQQLQ